MISYALWYEGAPAVIHEAFLARVPVVASGHGGMAELIEHGVNGLLFPAGDAASLAAQFRRLITEPGLWQRLADRPQQVLSIEENAARHLELYRSLLPCRVSEQVPGPRQRQA